ncbi:FAD:protein FMN transferase [Salinibacterium soli]|uniref:FAD:protein FMN transferase n=1 Tax=Antiquaquibacter soli TaxID=3064523 RepID=A0ABT9BP12_9MICO|nr:FAD:protein FMN transferase [Protaetiibacter sp. WY-16]MDO7882769.1 FAD:protein FMN transferase [Protaetiibacter sp. WY-16]
MRHAFETMGTVASLHLDGPVPASLIEAVENVFADYDAEFSLYRSDSPLSAIGDGRLRLTDAPARVIREYERALDWNRRTTGWFSPHRPDGVLDLSGTIKAVAIGDAVELLASAGGSGLLGVGGDVAAIGTGIHRIGVVDPRDRGRVLADPVLDARRAIATSGSAERGDHIWSSLGRTDILQATVLADDIVTADAVATAIVAAGTAHCGDLLDALPVDALIVSAEGLSATPGWPRVAS